MAVQVTRKKGQYADSHDIIIITNADGSTTELTRRGTNKKGGDGLKSNNLFSKGSAEVLNKIVEHFLKTGEILSQKESGANSEGGYNNAVDDLKSIMEYNDIPFGEYQENFTKYGKGKVTDEDIKKFNNFGTLTPSKEQEANYEKYGKANPTDEEKKDFDVLPPEDQEKVKDGNLNTSNKGQSSGDSPGDDPYGMKDLFDFDTEGSTANKLYEMYREINQGQYDSAKLESQYQERDMNKLISGERQALMDQIREDRRRGLKSGLSQSAIANREIQGLLQGQAMASGLGEEFLSERRQLNSMGQNIDAMSKGQVIDGYNQGLGNVISGNRAAGAGDFYSQFLNWKNSGARNKSLYEEYNEKYGSGQK